MGLQLTWVSFESSGLLRKSAFRSVFQKLSNKSSVPPVVQLKMGSPGPDRDSPKKTKLEHQLTREARDFFNDGSRELVNDEARYGVELENFQALL